MATIILATIHNAVLSMEVVNERITDVTLDMTNAMEPVQIRYPADGSKILVTATPGNSLSQHFVGANQLDRVMTNIIRPGDGTLQPSWIAPTYLFGNLGL